MQKIFTPAAIIMLCYVFYKFSASIEIISGVAIFLFGMLVLQDGFKMLSGGFLEKMMKKVTGNIFKSIAFGAISTTIMQSSTLISLFAISFVSASIISLIQGVGIIFGSNLGNSTGAWIIASIGNKANISAFALPIIAFGVIFLFHKLKAIKGFGYILAGIGFVFLGIAYIQMGFHKYQGTIEFAQYNIAGIKGMFVFLGIGLIATLIMQSTHATLVLIMATLSTGQISIDNGAALTIGAQLGSSITTGIGALNASIDGKRLAVAHIVFNIITAFFAILLIKQIIFIVDLIAMGVGIENINLKLAIFHTLFNCLGIAIMIPILNKFIYYLKKFISNKKQGDLDSPIYLDESKIDFANASLEAIRNETKHLYDNSLSIIAHSIGFDRSAIRSFEPIENLSNNKALLKDEIDIDSLYDTKIKSLSNAIIDFTTKAKTHMGKEEQMKEVFKLQMASKSIVEATKHMRLVQKNIQKYSMSENKILSKEYDKMRITLAHLLRSIEELRISDEDNVQILKKISKYKSSFNYDDFDILNKIDQLISQKSINISEGTSMINDLSFIKRIALALVEAISNLYNVDI
ncbi:Na/Pi cotransporter family protein [Helicobacter sp. MIT 14-3879]|uniref:Na/Pi cotransporter family protein n=1 Tax=Helicobacter sp. MIT 14-3879 TaxID=2040649 RepID=UPI000E1E4A2D|nr:Na/Pi symporter [Helicobacter sp. MIT 14-3879]RDU65466.1 Na/Pi-cotransporter [Helicobacter sp. MIT 14-3879]